MYPMQEVREEWVQKQGISSVKPLGIGVQGYSSRIWVWEILWWRAFCRFAQRKWIYRTLRNREAVLSKQTGKWAIVQGCFAVQKSRTITLQVGDEG
jgi:hypothetical protein